MNTRSSDTNDLKLGDATLEPAIDDLHPWLGLASFSEETRGYFYGREDEVGELARRVQRKLLTVLFGQSGLGKTSILRAGIGPRLRSQGYCPVYVRIDYGPDAPTPAQQVRQVIAQATAEGGKTLSNAPLDAQSPWEFLHQRDQVLKDAHGKPLIPLLIFDQFEEIFTLAQGDAGGRSRAAIFIEALAELVENRPSRALEARLEEDDTVIERLDFARSDYRILIALREDYLPHLEGLKAEMPSITQNRMRLAPMSGQQALAAVTGPGGVLLSTEVAEAIVRFVAGGAELQHVQVEPSLLSLICRELNDKRIAAGRATITLDLLAGSHASILTDFYERALADQPEPVRSLVEDVLLTDSGYRENVAEERVLRALSAAGAAPDALSVLVNRRLLRIEERLDVRRVELTHDVLCSVVSASRAQRHEREALQNLVDKQKTQQKLLLKEKMASLGTLTAGVAHEINNPTNFVHVAAQNLRVDVVEFQQFTANLVEADEAPEILQAFTERFAKLSGHINTMLNGTERIKAIVKDLRTFTHTDQSQKYSFRISECLISTLNFVRSSWQDKIDFFSEFIDDPEIVCWPALLNQVFIHLIVNGAQAIAEKQKLDRSVRGRIVIRMQIKGDHLQIDFSDNGVGMSAELPTRVLEPFFTTKPVGEGTGLGLSISYGIILQHAGEIQIDSTPGAGSRFSVRLPCNG